MVEEVTVKEGVEEETVEAVKSLGEKYKYGFETDIEIEYAPLGLNEDIVRLISEKNEEPEWMLEWRLDAFRRWQQMEEPEWAMVDYPKIDFQNQYYLGSVLIHQQNHLYWSFQVVDIFPTQSKRCYPLLNQL